MSSKVTIRHADRILEVAPGTTILEAALDAGIAYPHGCRSGNCGACKSHLLGGDVEMSGYADFALTGVERASGLILACRAEPAGDCEIAWPEQETVVAHDLRKLACTVAQLDRLTHDIVRVRLRIDEGGPFAFSAGQYARVRFGDLPPRDYSMANSPSEDMIEFHIREMADGAVSAYAGRVLKRGDTVTVDGPYGTSYLREDHTGPVIALAGGSGLAPVKAIVERALANGMRQPIRMYVGVRDERDVYLEDHFQALADSHENFTFDVVLSEPGRETDRRTGYLADIVESEFENLDGAKAYLAGPPVMVETCVDALISRGIRGADCHADAFYTEAEKAKLATS